MRHHECAFSSRFRREGPMLAGSGGWIMSSAPETAVLAASPPPTRPRRRTDLATVNGPGGCNLGRTGRHPDLGALANRQSWERQSSSNEAAVPEYESANAVHDRHP
jgi:hypothetical protein